MNIYDHIYRLAFPYLQTRSNEIHTPISRNFAKTLLLTERGDPGVVIPAIILHDVGWSKLTEELQFKAFGFANFDKNLNRIHEVEGVKIATRILTEVNYNSAKTEQIINIIDGHDSRHNALNENDMLVKDADKLFRYTSEGLVFNLNSFSPSFEDWCSSLSSKIERWFFTQSAKAIALGELQERLN